MTYFITKVLNPNKGYPCVFRQHTADSHCRFMHGYDLIFSITLEAEELTKEGWVYDFGNFWSLKERIERHFDHKLLVAEDDPYKDVIEQLAFIGIADVVIMPKVGVEAFACWLAVEATDMLTATGDLGRVRVRHTHVAENGSNTGGYIV